MFSPRLSPLIRAAVVEFTDEQAEVGRINRAVEVEISGGVVAAASGAGAGIKRADENAEVRGVNAVVVVGVSGGQGHVRKGGCRANSDRRQQDAQVFRALDSNVEGSTRDIGQAERSETANRLPLSAAHQRRRLPPLCSDCGTQCETFQAARGN